MRRESSMTFAAAAPVAVPARPQRARTTTRRGYIRWWEWSFPLAVSSVMLALLWLLYHTGYRNASPTATFMGLVGADAIDDNNVYIALMRQAANGSMLFTN